jgi:AcrR family transcriptional regulator
MKATTKKLSKTERRDQLLDTAMALVREGGADALTLARLAERAGVSKPIAYDHFGTRENLMISLYRRIDERQVAALVEALEQLPQKLDAVAQAMAAAYLSCAVSIGPEWHALSAALKGSEAMETVQRELIEGYVALYRDALRPFAGPVAPDEFQLRCVGIIGAAEAISGEVLKGRARENLATRTLARLIMDVVSSGHND